MSWHIVLVGLLGVGKTTVGHELAVLLDRPLVEVADHAVDVDQLAAADVAAAIAAHWQLGLGQDEVGGEGG